MAGGLQNPDPLPSENAPAPTQSSLSGMRWQVLFWTVLLMMAATLAFIAWQQGIDLETLRAYRPYLTQAIQQGGVFSSVIFVGAAIILLLIPFPLGSVVTASAGFLFGPYLGTALMSIATLVSGTTLYLMSKSTFGHLLQRQVGFMPRVKEVSRQNPIIYVLALRLMPALPFFVVSIIPALAGIGIRPYLFASLVGSAPGLFAVAVVGAGLDAVFEAGGDLSSFQLMSEQTFLLLTALSILALVSVVQRKLFRGMSIKD